MDGETAGYAGLDLTRLDVLAEVRRFPPSIAETYLALVRCSSREATARTARRVIALIRSLIAIECLIVRKEVEIYAPMSESSATRSPCTRI